MAALYISLSLLTAIFFLLTRDSVVEVKKSESLVIKINLIFFAITLIDKDKKRKKKKKQDKDKSLYRLIYPKIKKLLSISYIEVKRLYIPFFSLPASPADVPLLFGNQAINLAIISYLISYAKDFKICDGATDGIPPGESCDTVFHFLVKAPLIHLIYTILSVKRLAKKNEKRKTKYVANQNG